MLTPPGAAFTQAMAALSQKERAVQVTLNGVTGRVHLSSSYTLVSPLSHVHDPDCVCELTRNCRALQRAVRRELAHAIWVGEIATTMNHGERARRRCCSVCSLS